MKIIQLITLITISLGSFQAIWCQPASYYTFSLFVPGHAPLTNTLLLQNGDLNSIIKTFNEYAISYDYSLSKESKEEDKEVITIIIKNSQGKDVYNREIDYKGPHAMNAIFYYQTTVVKYLL